MSASAQAQAPAESAPAPRRLPSAAVLGRILGPQQVGLLIVLVLMCVYFTAMTPDFATTRNITNLLQNVAFLGIITMGMTLVLVAGEIDISVGSAIGFYSALLGVLYERGWSIWLAIALVIVLGTAIGSSAGWVRHRFGVPSFIVTLALLSSLHGAALWMTDSNPIPILDNDFAFLGAGKIAGIPFPLIVFAVVFAVFWFIAEKTTFGRSVYAVGGNSEAARISGISLMRVRVLIFACTGMLAAVSAVEFSSLIGSGNGGIGAGAEFQVIAAVIVGGTSLFGGRGRMVGTLLGVLFIGVLNNGMVLMGVNQYAQEVIQGAIILLAVLVSEGLHGGGVRRRFSGMWQR